ncbi:MAG: peptidoglycan DD-metalloendopeptidase family protein [Sphingomonadaceae bacterium]
MKVGIWGWGTGLAISGIAAALLVAVTWPSLAQAPFPGSKLTATAADLAQARAQSARARQRAADFERQARQSSEAANKAMLQAAALAARVQQAEAAVSETDAALSLITQQRNALGRKLAVERQPIADLTAALAAMVRRPMVLGLLRPSSLQDTVHLNAILAGTVPRIRAQTAQLRSELDRARSLEQASQDAAKRQRSARSALVEQRNRLAAFAASQRIVARRATGSADREAARAFALAEQARDLGGLVDRLERAGDLRQKLAALPGPILRPSDPSRVVMPVTGQPALRPADAPRPYRLPVVGRIQSGFGEIGSGGERREGLTLSPAGGAQVVAPGAGRVAFAGPYRGYGQIVIIEHAGAWTSLVTGLSTLEVAVGDTVVAGSPLGNAATGAPSITLELRHDGKPVNPIPLLR